MKASFPSSFQSQLDSLSMHFKSVLRQQPATLNMDDLRTRLPVVAQEDVRSPWLSLNSHANDPVSNSDACISSNLDGPLVYQSSSSMENLKAVTKSCLDVQAGDVSVRPGPTESCRKEQ